MKKIAILKHNYCLFFDNSIFLKDNSSLSIEMQAFRFYKNALKSIEELKKIEEISFIALWRKKTKVCYLYKTTNWPEQTNEIIEKMKKIYKFKRKKEFVIKKFEKIRGW